MQWFEPLRLNVGNAEQISCGALQRRGWLIQDVRRLINDHYSPTRRNHLRCMLQTRLGDRSS